MTSPSIAAVHAAAGRDLFVFSSYTSV